jgi:hypothetical protein
LSTGRADGRGATDCELWDCLVAEVAGVQKAAAGLPRVDGPV